MCSMETIYELEKIINQAFTFTFKELFSIGAGVVVAQQ